MAGKEDQIKTTIAVDGEKEYKTACKEINSTLRLIGSEMKVVSATFAGNEKSVAGLTAKQDVLKKRFEEQQKTVTAAEDALRKMKEGGLDPTDTAYLKMQTNLNNATAEMIKTEKEIDKTEQELEEAEKSASKFSGEIDDTGEKTDNAGGKFEKFRDVVGKVAKTVAVGIATMTVAAGALAVKIGTEVVNAFGELEQNLGGSEAVFGQYAKSIQKSGEEAYKNLGVSQSEYLATANKMGALFQGSGVQQQKSLELTEKAMQRAADMASVMGIDTKDALESVAGAAKGNFTMMDNLGVAMNATSIEAYALSKGLDFAWNSATEAEKAEVAMQMFFEKTEQYAGNFARESTETISGSIGLLKASVQSLTAGLGNSGADISNLTSNVVDAFSAVIENVTPIIQNIAQALPKALKTAMADIGVLIPGLIEVAVDLFNEIFGVIAESLPMLIDMGVQMIQSLVEGLAGNASMIATAAVKVIETLVGGITNLLPVIINGAMKIIIGLAQGLGKSLPR